MMQERELLHLKEKIELAKQDLASLKGKQTYLLQQLNSEFGCKTIEEAKKKLPTK